MVDEVFYLDLDGSMRQRGRVCLLQCREVKCRRAKRPDLPAISSGVDESSPIVVSYRACSWSVPGDVLDCDQSWWRRLPGERRAMPVEVRADGRAHGMIIIDACPTLIGHVDRPGWKEGFSSAQNIGPPQQCFPSRIGRAFPCTT